METKNVVKRRNQIAEPNRWAVVLPGFPEEAREKVIVRAKEHRMGVGAYIAMLLEKDVNESTAM